MANLQNIERLSGEYAENYGALEGLVAEMERHIEHVREKHLPGIKKAVRATVASHSKLKEAIEGNPQLFEKPKTRTFNGVKCGLKKGKGKLEFKYSEERTIEKIEQLFPGDAYEGLELIQASYSIRKTALSRMEVADLKRLGVTIDDTGDEVVIKVMDSEGAKLVQAYLNEAGIKEG